MTLTMEKRSTVPAAPPEIGGKLALLPRADRAPYPIHVAVETKR